MFSRDTVNKLGWGLEGGGIGVESKQDKETESARAEEKATLSRVKGSFFKKVFYYKKDPPIAL